MNSNTFIEQHCIHIQNRCYELMLEQINKRYFMMLANVTMTVAGLAFVKDSENVDTCIMIIVWSFLSAFNFTLGFSIIRVVKWQYTYKYCYAILNKIILSDKDYQTWDKVLDYIYASFASISPNSDNALPKSATKILMFVYYLCSLLPITLLIYILYKKWSNLIIFVSVGIIIVWFYTILYFHQLQTPRKLDKNFWLLKYQ